MQTMERNTGEHLEHQEHLLAGISRLGSDHLDYVDSWTWWMRMESNRIR